MSNTIRIALIGGGAGIAPTHLAAIAALANAELVGISDVSAERAAPRAALAQVPLFDNHQAMLRAVRPDLVAICTPHPSHAVLAMECLAAGAHVLVEKPLAVEVAEADLMIAAAAAAGRLIAVSYQQRFRAEVALAHELITAGTLGTLVRVHCVEPWFRTAAYYRSAGWRGSWRGEGGGVLMNQAPHTLDLVCYLAGRPTRVWGATSTLHHAITAEDTAHALLSFAGGAPGYFFTSTAESGEQLLEIVGDRASIRLQSGKLTLTRFQPTQLEQLRGAANPFEGPIKSVEELSPPTAGVGGHHAVYADVVQAICTGGQPRCDGRSARASLELANAIVLSSYSERPIDLPLDRAAYSALLTELRAREE
ncbi:Gfo/Idh/MocA family oxidoreductase [Candidatus Gracilibacteria bacterium]|nr:Gfo/Idh/MocA family oxidoreductase [Candidatus Gracilibacteria bacterium]